MSRRAAVCIGVDRVNGMTPLLAASSGAKDFAAWASSQGMEVVLLTDDGGTPVKSSAVFDAIEPIATSGAYDKLIVYFSGHGILLAPGAEYWLLSGAPKNANEAINLLRTVEDARNTGIPHVIFISDACRSAADTPVLRGITGSLIFPAMDPPDQTSEIDIYFATRPGNPAYEVPEADAARAYRGLFTSCLLDVVSNPPSTLVQSTTDEGVTVRVLTTRDLRDYLESRVPVEAAAVDVKLTQKPEVRAGTVLPKYFARVDAFRGASVPRDVTALIREVASREPNGVLPVATADADYLVARAIVTAGGGVPPPGRGHFETQTGFSIYGSGISTVSAVKYRADPPFSDELPRADAMPPVHLRLHENPGVAPDPASIVLEFTSGTGAVLPVLPGFIGTVVVHGGVVTAVNFVPATTSWRYGEYQARAADLDRMKAIAALESQHGRFDLATQDPKQFADQIRQGKGIDPIMGLYAAYAYAQVGRLADALSVFNYMLDEEANLPVLFDVVLIAARHRAAAVAAAGRRIAPFCPLLAQGWALLMPGDAMHAPIHQQLRSHLLPALFSTLDPEGTQLAARALMARAVR